MQMFTCGENGEYCPELMLAFEYCNRRDIVSDVPPMLFPSLRLRPQLSTESLLGVDKIKPPHSLTTNSSLLLARCKIVYPPANPDYLTTPMLPQKRPVGRPRLYPKKEVDPNRVKRVAKGDKPLGRPRTRHLKPPVEKRPRGRPRKDASKELVSALSVLNAAAGVVEERASK